MLLHLVATILAVMTPIGDQAALAPATPPNPSLAPPDRVPDSVAQPTEPTRVDQNVSPTTHGMRTMGYYGQWLGECDGITGDWGGFRDTLMMDYGLNFNASYTSILQSNVHGGLGTGFYGASPIGVMLTADLDLLAGLRGSTFFIDLEHFNWYNGPLAGSGQRDKSGSWVGDNGNFIDPTNARLNQIAQLYWSQELLDDTLNAQFGKMDANEHFSSIQAAGSFIYSAVSYTPTLNQFLPTYPNEATALQLIWTLNNTVTGSFGWFDGTSAAFPSGPATGPRGPATFFDNAGHWFFITQWDANWSLSDTQPGTIGLGAWLQTGNTLTAGNSAAGVNDVPGFYVQWQQTIWAPDAQTADNNGGLAGFGQFGWSDPDKNPVHWSIMAGLNATGIIPGRPADSIGLQGSYCNFVDDAAIFQSMNADGSAGPSGGYESCIELYYLAQLTPCLYVQPGIEWIESPGGGSTPPLQNALVAYLQVGIEF